MSSPFRRPSPAPTSIIHPQSSPLDDAFFGMLTRVASVPVRQADQSDPGVLHHAGLSISVLRRIALRWCSRMRERKAFNRSELDGLIKALEDFSDAEFRDMIEGAAVLQRL